MDTIIQLADNLNIDDNLSSSDLERIINHIVPLGDDDREKIAEDLVKKGFLLKLSNTTDESDNFIRLVAQTIAELAKTGSVRAECVNDKLIEKLVPHLAIGDLSKNIQICRALGNICYDYDEGRTVLDEIGGLEKLVSLMKSLTDADMSENRQKLRMMACGCLLNVTNMNERLQEKATSLGICPVLEEYIKKYGKDDEDLISMILMTAGSLVDSEKCRDESVKCGLVNAVIDLYELVTVEDIDYIEDSIIDLLATVAESDDVKTLMCKTKLPSHLMNSVKRKENSTNEESLSVLKSAADLLMLLLIGNESMEALYHHGDGSIYQQCLAWMDSSNEYMCMSGALAVGNYARGDSHSTQLVEAGIQKKLLAVLKRQSDTSPSVLIVHAVLSSLRNLAIPAANKRILIDCDVIVEAMRFSTCEMMPIQFKLLGLLRMLVDGQAETAQNLGRNKDFMKKLIAACSVTDHAGVKGEAIRLLAWLVKHSQSSDVMDVIVTSQGLPHLVSMMTSEHTVMQNEALMALSLIAASLLDRYTSVFEGSDLISTLATFLSVKDRPTEILSNALTLVESLVKSESMKTAIANNSELISSLRELKNHEETTYSSKLVHILVTVGQG